MSFFTDLPPVPKNISTEERRKGRSLRLNWNSPDTNRTGPGVAIYLVEHRNTTSMQPNFDDDSPWTILSLVCVLFSPIANTFEVHSLLSQPYYLCLGKIMDFYALVIL